MVTRQQLDKYELTVGVECHVQLKSTTKLFAAVSNDATTAAPNTVVTPICFGLPGTLPVPNDEAIRLAVRAGIALNAKVANVSKFDRKHYFYPDLPKGYQITQYDEPIVGRGHVDIMADGQAVRVGITRAHLEEDAGKSTHPDGKDYSLVDLNRAGTPLLEIVSEPDLHSATAARVYARELYFLMKYADVSDVDLYHGNMRFDVNVSVATKGSTELGTRSETKNLNSFRSVERAVEFEFRRQVELLEKGKKVAQETRGWDDSRQKTFSQRSKEEAHDYRYFPDPDLPPIELTNEFISEQQHGMPKLPADIRQDFSQAGVDGRVIETLLEYPAIITKLYAAQEGGASQEDIVRIANWLANVVIAQLRDDQQIDLNNADDFFTDPLQLVKLSQMVSQGKLSSTGAKELLTTHYANFTDPNQLAQDANLLQVSDSDELEQAVEQVIQENPQAVADIKAGEQKAIGFLTGQVMKAMHGRANPQLVQQLLRQKLV